MPAAKFAKHRTTNTPESSPSKLRIPRAGDIYVQRSTNTGRYCAYQITHVENTLPRDCVDVLWLDWVGNALPTEVEIAAMRPLVITHHWNERGIDHRRVTPSIPPSTYQYIANRVPLVSATSRSFSSWPSARDQGAEVEAEWLDRNPERLRRFEAARNSERTITLGNQKVRESFMRATPEILDHITNLADLDKLPRLLEIEARGPRPDLIAYLRTHDLLSRLTWNEHGQHVLDFRGVPHIEQIKLDVTGLETLYLHETLRTLTLTGTLHPRLRIHAHDDGALLTLGAPLAIAAPAQTDPGLPRLAHLYIEGITQLDLAAIVTLFPALERLVLIGKPGTLQNFSAIARLPNLHHLHIEELFGYAAADFPPPDTYPHLALLSLESIPADVATHVKKIYAPLKKTRILDLDVRKPRAPEWLAENLDNPFRAWDGSEFVTPANARRAAALYRKTLAELHARLEAPDAPTALPIWLNTLMRDWAATFNAWDKRTSWIMTEERETIFEAIENILLYAARSLPAAKIEVSALMNVFDELRDF
ncbi:MAG: hypothetical protein FWC42_03345 [Proteobacteria bacterium]|nr:hypothetical protein [Pseudomonadota bacterium]